MRTYILAVLILFVYCISYARENGPATENNDTVATNLREFVVESKNAWIENDKAVFVPTRREKNRANSPASLISSMNIPVIKVEDDVMKDLRGQNVVIFINGQEATGVELSTFWPREVIRVEYLSEPSDPKFKGYNAVVNFIVPEYSVGGVTKAGTYQSLMPYMSRYDLSSKLVYKRMTYGVMVNGYMRNERAGQTKTTSDDIYRGIWYGGRKYDELTNTSEETGKDNVYNVNAVFNAIYTGKENNVRIIHTASLAWSRLNGRRDVTNSWTPDIFNSDIAWNSNARHSLSPQLSGSYYWKLSSKFQLNADWYYSFASIDHEVSNRTADMPVIYNRSKEKANAVGVTALLTYVFNPMASLQLQLVENLNTYSIQYEGTYENLSRQTMSVSKIAVRGYWQPRNNLAFVAIPGFTINSRSIKGMKSDTSVNPYFFAALNWYESDKAYLNIDGNYYLLNVNASAANEVLQRQSELMWYKGNPELGNMHTFTAGIQQVWMAAEWLTPSVGVRYTDTNPTYTDYLVAPEDMEGLISQSVQSVDRMWNINLDLNSNLFNRKVTISLSPYVLLQQCGTSSSLKKLNTFNFYGQVNYNFGNFSVNVSYTAKDKLLAAGGHFLQYRPDRWGAGITYGNGDLYVSFRVSDIFRTRVSHIYDYTYDNYVNRQTVNQTGRSFSLNLSYTFGYGKRVNKNIEIKGPSQIASGAAGS